MNTSDKNFNDPNDFSDELQEIELEFSKLEPSEAAMEKWKNALNSTYANTIASEADGSLETAEMDGQSKASQSKQSLPRKKTRKDFNFKLWTSVLTANLVVGLIVLLNLPIVDMEYRGQVIKVDLNKINSTSELELASSYIKNLERLAEMKFTFDNSGNLYIAIPKTEYHRSGNVIENELSKSSFVKTFSSRQVTENVNRNILYFLNPKDKNSEEQNNNGFYTASFEQLTDLQQFATLRPFGTGDDFSSQTDRSLRSTFALNSEASPSDNDTLSADNLRAPTLISNSQSATTVSGQK